MNVSVTAYTNQTFMTPVFFESISFLEMNYEI